LTTLQVPSIGVLPPTEPGVRLSTSTVLDHEYTKQIPLRMMGNVKAGYQTRVYFFSMALP
jgi:hypothetical protein